MVGLLYFKEMASNEDNNCKPAEEDSKQKKDRKRYAQSDSRQRSRTSRRPCNGGHTLNLTVQCRKIENVLVGNNSVMNINSHSSSTRSGPYTRSQAKESSTEEEVELTDEQRSILSDLQDCSKEVDSNMMAELSKSWDRSYQKNARMLLDEASVNNICDNVREDDQFLKRREVSYKVLVTWKEKTDDPSVKNLISILTSSGGYSAIKSLLSPNWTND